MVTISCEKEAPASTPALQAARLTSVSAETRLAALLAGARARGLADTLDMLGVAAVLIDADGAALHVNAKAAAFIGLNLGICAGQLGASTFESHDALQRALELVLRHGGSEAVEITSETGGAATRLHVLGAPEAAEDATQLLKAVIVFEPRAGRCGEATLAARILRQSAPSN